MIFDGNLDILLFVVMGLRILFKPFNANTALSGKGEGTSLLLRVEVATVAIQPPLTPGGDGIPHDFWRGRTSGSPYRVH